MNEIAVAKSDEVKENELLSVKADGQSLLLTRVAGKPQAFASKCPHLGLSLARGKLEGGTITCPWHGSRFDVCSGQNLDWCTAVVGVPVPAWTSKLLALGKQPASLPVFEAGEKNGSVFVRIPA